MPSSTDSATLYLRSSKDRNDVSIDAQRRLLHELAQARGLVVVGEFADAVESGKDDDRPGFQRLLYELKRPGRPWSTVLMLDTARLGRRRLISLMFEEMDCKRHGVRVVYRSVPEMADQATEMILRAVMQAFDEYHSLVSRQKGMAGMAENVRQGWRAGGRAPRGYRLEYHATGAIREGQPVTKSRLAIDDDSAPEVQRYLRLRAQGVSRGPAIARLQLRWPATSTHSMDWQALTYAGHTVWGMHTDAEGEKRKPRGQWLVQRDTHPALISDDEAEAILRQMEAGAAGRRVRRTPLLFAGLVVSPDGQPWHSDGCGSYRLGKGRKVAAARLEPALLEQLGRDLASDDTVQLLRVAMDQIAGAGQVDGRRLAGMDRQIAALASQISRTVDLAAGLDDPAPVLRRVADLEHQRQVLVDQLEQLKLRQAQARGAATVDDAQIRALLRRLLAGLSGDPGDDAREAAQQALLEVIEHIELDPLTTTARLHYAVQTGVNVASPRGPDQSPVVRWQSGPVTLRRRRAA